MSCKKEFCLIFFINDLFDQLLPVNDSPAQIKCECSSAAHYSWTRLVRILYVGLLAHQTGRSM